MEQLKPVKDLGYSRGHQEDARRKCIESFYLNIINKIPVEEQISSIVNHSLTTQILSSIYVSAALDAQDKNSKICESIKNKKNVYV